MYICNKEIKIIGRVLRIARLDADMYQFMSDPEPVISGLRKSGHRIDLFTFIQGLTETKPKYQYPVEWDNYAALPISTFDNWWNKQIDGKTRNMVRKAEKKEVVVREIPFDENLARGIWRIYNEVPFRQGRKFSHYGKDLERVYKDEATYLDSSTFIGAFYGEELIGFVKLVADEARVQAGLMNIVSKIQHRDKAPTNALVAHAVRSCADRGISYMVYARFDYGKEHGDGLSDFKERNGFQRIEVPRYYVPLTAFGWAAFRLGMHHPWVNYFPQPLVEKLRGIRNNWYNRKSNL